MGIKLMEIGTYMRKGLIFTIRSCCISLWKHPFFACLMWAFIYMSKSYPSTFALLLSASPVVVCTAVLLGILLVSGQKKIPETEKEKRERYHAIALKHGMFYDANLDEQCVESYSKSERDEVGKVGGSVDGGGGGAESKERRSVENKSERSETRELDGLIQQQKSELSEERLGDGEGMVDHYAIISKVIDELLESESEPEKSEEDCSGSGSDSGSGSERENVDSPSHQVQGHKDDEAESSSTDASINEMRPMLDELHPLLDEDAAQPVQMSGVGSEANTTTSSSSIESGEETEVHGSEAADDDGDDEVKKDQTNSVITWTEEDEKNLMDVGSSEIERNQRLERILRRRKNMSMVPEINLIDFENSDFQLNIAPISTSRRNPFDSPLDVYDSNDPGSAPSVLSQRRNPFDLPYDEDQGENREELRPASQPRQPFLRRRDNFRPRLSIFAPKGQEKQPARFRPLFIPEHTVFEESSYSSFRGQSSGVSYGHETESVSSVEYVEEGWFTPHQGMDHTTGFSDAHPELDSCLQPHGYVTDKQTQGDSSSRCNDHASTNPPSDDEGQMVESCT